MVVKDIDTLPAVMSAGDGVYVVVGLFGLPKVPVPLDVHVTLVALPPKDPDKFAVALSAQTVRSGPALAEGVGAIVMVIWSLAAMQGPAGSSVVRVRTTVPAAISAGEGA